MDALQEQFFLTKQKRIELFGEQLNALKDELKERNLSNIPTERLFELLAKYDKILRDEVEPTTFRKITKLDILDLDLNSSIDIWEI